MVKLDKKISDGLLVAFKKFGKPLVLGHRGLSYPKLPIGTIIMVNEQPFAVIRYISDNEMGELSKIRGPYDSRFKYNYEISTD